MLVVVGLVASLAVATSTTARRGSSSVLPEVWNDIAYQYLEREGWNPGCRTCPKIKQLLERRLPDLNLTFIRVEMAKQEILRKLGMTTPPNPKVSYSSLPVPIAEGNVFTKSKDRNPTSSPPTERVISFASDISCAVDSKGISLKLRFLIPEQARQSSLVSGKLWLFSDLAWIGKGNGLISAKPCSAQSAATARAKPLTFLPQDAKGEWLEKDVTWMLQENEECYNFKVAWAADPPASVNCSQYIERSKKPFLSMDIVTEDIADVFRGKRNVDCTEGVPDCCREKLYISFADIGWANWIYQPKGYEAYYCKGNCANVAALSLGASPYQSVIKRLLQNKGHLLDITPCCTPTRLSPVQLIYAGNNGTVVQKTIPNLTVESCGCM